ncbi:hypothetical protein HU724_019155 [Pseudomonas iranensis]|uniref:hypothetical protein n=1 Tax=Pseudomonas iranensis TaxID=2745503 RepID=UPI001647A38B|nr:hypothetical protein [Pseudomonas iranensis]QXI21132.1 hypothetical protein HU724_019155 [Pseudomonas iranensis]
MSEVKIEKRFCAFIDMLGFKSIVTKNGNANEACSQVVNALKAGLSALEQPKDLGLIDVKSFSDNVLISLRCDLGQVFVAPIFEFICRYQIELIRHGYFVRGGLALGGLYIDENAIYGEALIEAVDIEKDQAINPVVMLSQGVFDFAKTNSHLDVVSAVFNGRSCRSYVFERHGRYFVNYLRAAFVPNDDPEAGGIFPTKLDVQVIALHRDMIASNIKMYSASSKVLEKYLFLAVYHNKFCEECVGVVGYNESLKISSFGDEVNFVKGF